MRFFGLFIFIGIISYNAPFIGQGLFIGSKFLLFWYGFHTLFLIPFLLFSFKQGIAIANAGEAEKTTYNMFSIQLIQKPRLIFKVALERILLLLGTTGLYFFVNTTAMSPNEAIDLNVFVSLWLIFSGYLVKHYKI